MNIQKIKHDKAMTFRLGDDERLETSTRDILLVVIASVNGVPRVHAVLGLLSKELLKDLG